MGQNESQPRMCVNCFEEYTPNVAHQQYCCADCKREFYRKKYRENSAPKDPMEKFQPVITFMKKYYEETGKYIQYGKAVTMIEQQKKGREQWKR